VTSETYAPDGSPVALYAALGPMGEPEVIHAAVPEGAAILELGAGAGRITHGLVALGHDVVAVDQSPAMLSRIRGAETILADIETLELDRRFPVVVLASNFVNDVDRDRVRAFLDCCARHVVPDGQVLVQGFPSDWRPDSSWHDLAGARARLRSFTLDDRIVRGEMEYEVDGKGETLVHAFESLLVTADQLDRELEASGLRRRRFLDEGGSWLEAVPLELGT
jgi:SAM-dependent methyltransferase